MALKKNVALAGGLTAAGAYIMLNHARLDKITGDVAGTIEIYLDEATRRARQARYGDYSAATTATQAANDALAAFLPAAGDGADDILAKEQSSIPARGTLAIAAARAQAAGEMLKLQSLQAISTQNFNLNGPAAAKCVNADGTLNAAAVYGQLKALYFSGAEDC